MAIQQTLIRSLGDEPVPPPPILGLVLTSGLYPVLVEGDEALASATLLSANTYTFFGLEETFPRVTLQAAVLTSTIVYTSYTNWPFEQAYPQGTFLGATLTVTITFTNYTNWPFESAFPTAALGVGGAVLTVAIQYVTNAMQPEDAYAHATLQAATLA
jgi:hypothetical protein